MRLLGAALLAAAILATPARATGDRCLQCDVLYISDCNTGLWTVDLSTGVTTRIGLLPDVIFDLAVTSDGRLVGAGNAGELLEISACDASVRVIDGPSTGNALGADLRSTDLFTQGPPLVRLGSTPGSGNEVLGGTVGPSAPDWCGVSAGDVAMSPADFLVRTALECPCASGGSAIHVVDPATGAALSEARCLVDSRGRGWPDVYGIAYLSNGQLWAAQAVVAPRLLLIDEATGVATELPVTGGYTCGFGLASLPCGIVLPCMETVPPPASVGPALRVTDRGDPLAPLITARLSWPTDAGAPRGPEEHFHVLRGTDPRFLSLQRDVEPLAVTSYVDATPAAFPARLCHYYRVLAADECERESAD